jgi:hypothetical protein
VLRARRKKKREPRRIPGNCTVSKSKQNDWLAPELNIQLETRWPLTRNRTSGVLVELWYGKDLKQPEVLYTLTESLLKTNNSVNWRCDRQKFGKLICRWSTEGRSGRAGFIVGGYGHRVETGRILVQRTTNCHLDLQLVSLWIEARWTC